MSDAIEKAPRRTRSRRLLDSLKNAGQVVVVTHDSPDPDAIASGWGVCALVERTLKLPTKLLAGGVITRAENRTLVDVLKPPLEMTRYWRPSEETALVLVDTHSPPRFLHLPAKHPPAAVIDHHTAGKGSGRGLSFRFRDVRTSVLATSSIVTGYLREQDIDPSPSLATALTYGVYSDAVGYGNRFSRTDRVALAWLSQFLDPEILKMIEYATLPKEYYEDMLLALESSFTYDGVGVCFLPRASGAEVVGEIADLLIRCRDIDHVLCAALVGERIVISARTTPRGGNATELLDKTLNDLESASWGGHEHRAGGHIDVSRLDSAKKGMESDVRRRWLRATGVEKNRGVRLVAKKDILKALG